MAALGCSDFFDAQAKQLLRFWLFGTVQTVHLQGANFEAFLGSIEFEDVEAQEDELEAEIRFKFKLFLRFSLFRCQKFLN